MESVVCFPEPLGCFALPTGGFSSGQDNSEGEAYADEFILSDDTLAAALWEQDPPGCFMCIADTLGEED
jgi:hypothetical protein